MSEPEIRYEPARGRRFALTLAAAFAVIALVTVWSDRDRLAGVAGGLSLVLFVAAVVAPSHLGPLEAKWMKLSHAVSRVTTPVFMGIVYFLVLTPTGLIRRTFGRNPLMHQLNAGSYWVAREKREPAAARRRMERQF